MRLIICASINGLLMGVLGVVSSSIDGATTTHALLIGAAGLGLIINTFALATDQS